MMGRDFGDSGGLAYTWSGGGVADGISVVTSGGEAVGVEVGYVRSIVCGLSGKFI